MLLLLLLTLVLGCSYDEHTYEQDLLDAYCVKYMDCMHLFQTLDECRLDGPQGVMGVDCEPCTFNPGPAEDCLDEFEAMSCEDFIGWRSGDVDGPSVCGQVFSGCDVAEECGE